MVKTNRMAILINLLLRRNGVSRAKYLKEKHVFYEMGDHCYWHPNTIPNETYLLRIGNNVCVAARVNFVTHDIMEYMLNYRDKTLNLPQYIGPIDIKDNVFIGADSTILYNVTIGENSIIAAGSVVTKDVPPNSIVGGVPAKVIGSFDEFVEKRKKQKRPNKADGLEAIINYYWKGKL